MGSTVLAVVQGEPPERMATTRFHDTALTVIPVMAFLGLVLMLGLFIPAPLDALLKDAAAQVEVHP
jgi:hydrogenase-4 component F